MKQKLALVALILAFLLAAVFYCSSSSRVSASRNETTGRSLTGSSPENAIPANRADAKAILTRLPLSFEPNLGQVNSSAEFISRGAGFNLLLTAGEAVLEV